MVAWFESRTRLIISRDNFSIHTAIKDLFFIVGSIPTIGLPYSARIG
jgi:hypothetical protein